MATGNSLDMRSRPTVNLFNIKGDRERCEMKMINGRTAVRMFNVQSHTINSENFITQNDGQS